MLMARMVFKMLSMTARIPSRGGASGDAHGKYALQYASNEDGDDVRRFASDANGDDDDEHALQSSS
eukprot:5501079-Pyramimonas_sp.AAC.1